MSARRRVLSTGASGLLGGRVAELLARDHDVVALRHRSPTVPGIPFVDGDLLDAETLASALDRARPEAVVHSAARANADRCEAEPETARRVNVEGSAAVARLCHARGIRLVALSTDLVLTGDRAWSDETVATAPTLVYPRTKREAEDVVLSEAPGAAVVRVPLIVGRGHGPRLTASESIARALGRGERQRLFTDQFRTPLDPESLVDGLLRLLERPVRGLLHLGGPERVSRYELGLRVASVLGLPSDTIEPVTIAEYSPVAPRPADTSLDSSRARAELGWRPRPIDAAIRESRRATV